MLRASLLATQADILCFQETVAESFATDWDFLTGYESVLHRKGDLRCATFWRRDRFSLAADPQHPDRCLVTSLASLTSPGRRVHVVNCHLKAGADAARRLRQTTEALDQARKTAQRLGDEAASVVMAGDFNNDPEGTAVEHLLRQGEVDPSFREAEFGDQPLTSKTKKQPFGPFADAYEEVYGRKQCPATLLLPDRYGGFLDENGAFQPLVEGAVRALFRLFAGDQEVMDLPAVVRWITTINRRPGRGSEWTKAQRVFQAKGAEELAVSDLLAIYLAEVHEGKAWGVLHDLYRCGLGSGIRARGVFAGRFDQIHYTSRTLGLDAVRAPISEARRRDVYERQETLPNGWHPSDHLPVGAVFRW